MGVAGSSPTTSTECRSSWTCIRHMVPETFLYGELGEAVRGAWMVVQSVPEDLELKRQVFGELDRLSDADDSWRATRRHCPQARCFRMSNTGGGC